MTVNTDISHHRNFKGKSRVTHCENSKSHITLLGQIMLHAANLGLIMHHALLVIWVPSRVMENHFATL